MVRRKESSEVAKGLGVVSSTSLEDMIDQAAADADVPEQAEAMKRRLGLFGCLYFTTADAADIVASAGQHGDADRGFVSRLLGSLGQGG